MFVTALYKVYVIWTFCCTGNKAFMKVYQWFHLTPNLIFSEKSQPVPRPQNSIVRPCKFFLGDPVHRLNPALSHIVSGDQ